MTAFRGSGGAVADATLVLGAMSAAKDVAGRLDPVPDDLAAAMRARGRHRLDRAFEAVEGHRAATAGDLEGLVVIVAADTHWAIASLRRKALARHTAGVTARFRAGGELLAPLQHSRRGG